MRTAKCVRRRNKRSVGISFKDPRGQQILQRLAAESDVLVENYLPGTLERYGLSYKQLAAANPRLIYASITGCVRWAACVGSGPRFG